MATASRGLCNVKTFYVVRVNGDAADTHAAETLAEAVSIAMPDPGSRLAIGTVKARDAGAARLKCKSFPMVRSIP
jgi:hypothetical protein